MPSSAAKYIYHFPSKRWSSGAQISLLYGPLGLKKIIDAARSALPDERLSLTVEVHPQEGRLGLGEHAGLFRHWRDVGNAERMNHWVELMLRCARLVREACG